MALRLRISRSFISELVTRVDLVDLIGSYLTLKKAGKNYLALCPFHSEKTASFTISPDKQMYYCFGCGAHGNAVGFLMNYAKLEFVEAVQQLAAHQGIAVVYEEGGDFVEQPRYDELYAILERVNRHYQQQLRGSSRAIAYLKQRGLTGQIAEEFGVGYAPPGWNNLTTLLNTQEQLVHGIQAGLIKEDHGRYYDRFRDRILFPIHDLHGRVIAFGGRALSAENQPKYLNSPETPLFKKGQELYGLHRVRQLQAQTRIIIVEGYLDVVALAQYDIRNVVATLGTATTKVNLTRLFRHATEITFCFDGDEAGRKAAWKALEAVLPLLQSGQQVSFLLLPEGQDPDTLVRAEGTQGFNARLQTAKPLSDFLFETLQRQVNMSSLEGQTHLVEKLARPLLQKMTPGLYKDALQNRLAELTPLVSLADLEKSARLKPGRMTSRQTRSLRDYSPAYQAIVYLLDKPYLSRLVQPAREKFGHPSQADLNLLVEVLELIEEKPHLTPGALLEHWRGTEQESLINQLGNQEVLLNESEIEKEFEGIIQHFHQELKEQRIDFLIHKTDLSAEEKQELQELTSPTTGGTRL